MQAAIATLIGVLGTGLITVFIQSMRTMNSTVNARFDRLETKFDSLAGELKAHGERLARIETRLDINPPSEAA